MVFPSPFTLPTAIPFYPQCGLFSLMDGFVRQWEFNGWKAESLSWKQGCYLHAAQITRAGMVGLLAFELHGPLAHGPEIYDAIVQAGHPHRLERLGWHTFQINHVEGGFLQQFWTFSSAMHQDGGWRAFMGKLPFRFSDPVMAGSIDPADFCARCRTPIEVGWRKSVRFDHDFTGRAALEAELADPRRIVVTLEGGERDVIDIYASLFREGPEYKYLEIPVSPANRGLCGHADHVLAGDVPVGISSSTVYSYHFRKVRNHATIDLAQAQIGTGVTVLWGDHGGRIKTVRARVARFPYLQEGRNQSVDLTAGVNA